MKNTTCCITTFVFGERYQDYIPIFLYSIKKAYPEYYVMIFLNGELSNHVKVQLDILHEFWDFKIIENYYSEVDFSSSVMHGAAVRWILWDELFLNYDAIYIADIDIFYCKEETSLLEQHLTHCQTIQKPFSNIQRKPLDINPFNLRTLIKNITRQSVKYTLNKILLGKHTENKLSGLHFYLTKEYLGKIKPFYQKYEDIILNFKCISHHTNCFNDESCLYDIINDAGLTDNLPIMTTNKEMLSNSPNSPVFRPHHGLHLGIFRTKEYPLFQVEILETNIYKKYYKQFCELENDHIFKLLKPFFSTDMQTEINNIHTYYRDLKNA